MIEKVHTLPPLPQTPGVDLRIKALYKAYGETLLEVYCQFDGTAVTAVMAVLGSSCTLLTLDDPDFEELDSFLSFLKADVFCGSQAAKNLKPLFDDNVDLLEFKGGLPQYIKETQTKRSEIYKLLQNGTDGDIVLPSFDDWYADFCVRYNHGCAECFCIEDAVAVCGFLTENEALITGVAVDKKLRGRGLGRAVTEGLIIKLKSKNENMKIYVAATDGKAGFYEKIGFSNAGSVSVLKY